MRLRPSLARLACVSYCFRRPLAVTHLYPPPPPLARFNPFLLPSSFLWQKRNDLGPEGAGKLAGALEKMTGMQTLDLVRRGGGGCDLVCELVFVCASECVFVCVRVHVHVRVCATYICIYP
jgi:hypothetical protein